VELVDDRRRGRASRHARCNARRDIRSAPKSRIATRRRSIGSPPCARASLGL